MTASKKAEKYTKLIWEDQLPANEKNFLYILLTGGHSNDFEFDVQSDHSMFLAYNAGLHNYEGYSDEQIFFFKKTLNYHKSLLLKKIPSISKVLRLLNENGITPVLLKGAAFIAQYAPKLPRMMGDIDIYINPEQYEQAVSLILDHHFSFVSDTGYHIAVTSPELDIDIHRSIYKNGGDIYSDICQHLIETTFLSSRVYILSPEDMFIHQLANRSFDISASDHLKRHFKWIVDCYYLMNEFTPDVKRILEKARELKNYCYVLLTLSKLVELFPEKFTNTAIDITDSNYANWLKYTYRSMKRYDIVADKDAKGLKYFFDVFYYHYSKSKAAKYAEGSHKPVIFLILKETKIFSFKEFFSRLGLKIKRIFKRSVNEPSK